MKNRLSRLHKRFARWFRRHRKFVVVAVGEALAIIGYQFGVDSLVYLYAAGILTSFGVWRVPNTK